MVKEKKKRYWKVLSDDNKHYNMVYRPNAWNTDVLPYNPEGECQAGGLYFTDTANILQFLGYGNGICEVLDWRDDKNRKKFHSEGYKVKAHSIKLGEKRLISVELFMEFIGAGAMEPDEPGDKGYVKQLSILWYSVLYDDLDVFIWLLDCFKIPFETILHRAKLARAEKILNYIEDHRVRLQNS